MLGSGAALNKPFEVTDFQDIDGFTREGKMRIKGNPSLGYVKGIMIGVVNRSDEKPVF